MLSDPEELNQIKFIKLNMKKIILVILFITAVVTTPAQIEESGWNGKFGVAAGYSPMWIIPNTTPVNNYLKSFGVPALTNSGFYAGGFSGFVYLTMVNNLRVGGLLFDGSTRESISAGTTEKNIIYSVDGGGLTVEYSLPVKGMALSVGLLIGKAQMNIELLKNNTNIDWNDIIKFDNQSVENIKLTNNYYILSPTVNLDIPAARFISFRIGAGYQFNLGDEWKLNNISKINNVPDDITGKAFFIQTGIYIGLFAF